MICPTAPPKLPKRLLLSDIEAINSLSVSFFAMMFQSFYVSDYWISAVTCTSQSA